MKHPVKEYPRTIRAKPLRSIPLHCSRVLYKSAISFCLPPSYHTLFICMWQRNTVMMEKESTLLS